MRVFLLSIIAVLTVAASAYLVLEGAVRRNAGDTFSRPPSPRVSDANKPPPSGTHTVERAPPRGAPDGPD